MNEGARAESLPGTLRAFGSPPRAVEVVVVNLGVGRRAARAVGVLAACWALAFVAVFLPILHFVLVPAFLVAGPVLAVWRLREGRRLAGIRGACPRCGVSQEFRPGGACRARRVIDCPLCHTDLTLEVSLTAEGSSGAEASASNA
jgi:hypothetical protein